jgi:hypothetical protein
MKTKEFSPVKGMLTSDYKVNLKINVIGLGEISKGKVFGPCKPRKTGQDDSDLPKIPGWSREQLLQLSTANQKIMSWMKKSKTNKKLFFNDPTKAISTAGIKLDRSLHKKIARTRKSSSKNATIKEGINLGDIHLSAKKMITKTFLNH